MSQVELALEELFYGAGAWLGLLILLGLIVVLILKNKFVAMLMLPVTIFLGMDYLDNSLYWQSIIMWLSSIFILLNLMKTRGD